VTRAGDLGIGVTGAGVTFGFGEASCLGVGSFFECGVGFGVGAGFGVGVGTGVGVDFGLGAGVGVGVGFGVGFGVGRGVSSTARAFGFGFGAGVAFGEGVAGTVRISSRAFKNWRFRSSSVCDGCSA
jgi:hypothetical protein